MKKSELIQIIREEIESALLEEKKPSVAPDQAMSMLVKATGPLKGKDGDSLDTKSLFDVHGLHRAISRASAFYPAEKLVSISASQMKESEKEGTTGAQADALAKKLFGMVRKQEEIAKKGKQPQQDSQDPSQPKVLSINLGADETLIATVAGPQGTKKIQVKKRGGNLKIQKQLAAQDALKQYATSAKAP